jgi:hypothetical protein
MPDTPIAGFGRRARHPDAAEHLLPTHLTMCGIPSVSRFSGRFLANPEPTMN